ncbi:hypothetical protein GLOIN_2v1551309, partial [Rhizophagus irregularis DAOM 181602=DAOM 197198]
MSVFTFFYAYTSKNENPVYIISTNHLFLSCSTNFIIYNACPILIFNGLMSFPSQMEKRFHQRI